MTFLNDVLDEHPGKVEAWRVQHLTGPVQSAYRNEIKSQLHPKRLDEYGAREML